MAKAILPNVACLLDRPDHVDQSPPSRAAKKVMKVGLLAQPAPTVSETLKAVTEAAEEATKGKVARVLTLWKGVKDGGEAAAGIGVLVGKG